MIANENQAHQAYQLLRPNGDGNQAEIAATAGKRSWAQFATDAQGEVQARNAAIRDTQSKLGEMQGIIDSNNQTVTELRDTISNAQISNAEKQIRLDAALNQIANDNTQLTTLHDQVSDLQGKLADPLQAASAAVDGAVKLAKEKAGKSGGFAVAFFRFLLNIKLSKIFPKLKKS